MTTKASLSPGENGERDENGDAHALGGVQGKGGGWAGSLGQRDENGDAYALGGVQGTGDATDSFRACNRRRLRALAEYSEAFDEGAEDAEAFDEDDDARLPRHVRPR